MRPQIVSLFSRTPKSSASKPPSPPSSANGQIQEAEQQIVTHYEVYDERPSDADLLIPALEVHASFGSSLSSSAARAAHTLR